MPQNRPVPRFYFRKTAKGNQGGSQHEKQRAGGDRPAKRYHEALPEIIENVNAAIDWAVEKELWVIYIQHNNLSAGTRTFKPGTRGAELVPELKVVIRPHVYKGKEQRPDQRVLRRLSSEHGITHCYHCRCRRRGLHQIHLLQHEEKRLCRPMCCRTASPATTKRSCRSYLPTMKVRLRRHDASGGHAAVGFGIKQ